VLQDTRLFIGEISYITKKGVEKTAHLQTKAHDEASAKAEFRRMIMSNGLRQAKSVKDITFLNKMPEAQEKQPKAQKAQKAQKAARSMGKSQATGTQIKAPKSQAKRGRPKNSDRQFAQRAADQTFARSTWSEDAPRFSSLSSLWALPAAFIAGAAATFGSMKSGLFNR
jgi:hypothetical protein